MNVSWECGWPYSNRLVPLPITKQNMAAHSPELCEDKGNSLRRLLRLDECECPCHEGEEMASTLRRW